MLPPIQVDVARESVNLWNLNQLVGRLHDVPRRGMLHKKWIVECLAPFRAERDDIAGSLARLRRLIRFDNFGLERGFRDYLFQDSSKAASPDVVHSLPGS
jgi:hypothetical protein